MRSVRLTRSVVVLAGLLWPAMAWGKSTGRHTAAATGTSDGPRSRRSRRRTCNRLVPRMMFQTGISKLGSFENTPIVLEARCTSRRRTAKPRSHTTCKTKRQLWRYEHKTRHVISCCGPDNRGVCSRTGGKVYMGTLDARLVALDARRRRSEVGHGSWRTPRWLQHHQAPLIVGDNVIVGVSGGEYGIRGHVTAYNAMTGKQAWRWYSIPAPKGDPTFDEKAPNGWWGTWATKAEDADLHRDIAKEKADSAKYADAWKTGGGGVWMTPAYDKESNTIFVAVGNPSPDLDGSVRPGDNLYTDAMVAIDAADRQDQMVLPDHTARRLGPRRRLPAGRGNAGR